MEESHSETESVIEALSAFAREHGLVLPTEACIAAHAARYVKLGHCPCDERRPHCPCDEALDDIETLGRCECGVLIDPAKLLQSRQAHSVVDSD